MLEKKPLNFYYLNSNIFPIYSYPHAVSSKFSSFLEELKNSVPSEEQAKPYTIPLEQQADVPECCLFFHMASLRVLVDWLVVLFDFWFPWAVFFAIRKWVEGFLFFVHYRLVCADSSNFIKPRERPKKSVCCVSFILQSWKEEP